MALKDLVKRRTAIPAGLDNPFELLQERMNQMFEDFWKTPALSISRFGTDFGDFMPRIEVSESDKTIDVSAELPGLSQKDVQVTLSEHNDMLTLQGEKRFEEERKEDNYLRSERSYGSFRRTIPLPTPVEPNSVEATFKAGILRIKLGKAPEETRGVRKIAVKGM